MSTENDRAISNETGRKLANGGVLRLGFLFIGIAAIFAFPKAAGAADWYTGDKSSEPDYAPSVVLDASASLTSKGSDFGAFALTAAIDGDLRQEGFRARIEGIAGEYNYFATLPPVPPATAGLQKRIYAHQEDAGVLGGYAWASRDWTAAIFGGTEIINTALSPLDPNNTTKGLRIGAKIAGEFYGNPTHSTMLSGYGSYSTTDNDYYTRFKAGYRLWGNVFGGPEFMALGNQFYSEYRAGIHLTGLQIGHLSLGVSGGATSNRISGSGGYGTFDARIGF